MRGILRAGSSGLEDFNRRLGEWAWVLDIYLWTGSVCYGGVALSRIEGKGFPARALATTPHVVS
jgi:hypothetical protein